MTSLTRQKRNHLVRIRSFRLSLFQKCSLCKPVLFLLDRPRDTEPLRLSCRQNRRAPGLGDRVPEPRPQSRNSYEVRSARGELQKSVRWTDFSRGVDLQERATPYDTAVRQHGGTLRTVEICTNFPPSPKTKSRPPSAFCYLSILQPLSSIFCHLTISHLSSDVSARTRQISLTMPTCG